MSRERYQRGSLKKVGKTRKMWRGRWHVYVKQPDGVREDLQARKDSRAGIGADQRPGPGEARRGDQGERRPRVSSGSARPMPTFAEVWKRYAALKSASWSTATRKAIASVFAGEAKRRNDRAYSL